MNDDDLRIERYLSAQADAIALTPADPRAAKRRGARRRSQRRAGVLGAIAVLAVGATSVAVYDAGDPGVASSELAAAPSTYDWTAVQPTSGLAFSAGLARLADGTAYSLSTAPGAPGDDTAAWSNRHLYRSDDDREWTEVSLPAGLTPTGLASAGDTLYAIGTAPAGGDTRSLVVAKSVDGAASWATITLPSEIAALEARHPGQITIGQPTIAAQDATHQVAAVTVSATIDPHTLIDDLPESANWDITPGGLRVYDSAGAKQCVDVDVDGADGAVGVRCAVDPGSGLLAERGPLIGEYPWAALGVDPELQAFLGGRTYLYVTEDGATFERVDVPGDPGGWGGPLIATADGYRYFSGSMVDEAATTTVLASDDGRSWTSVARLPGSPSDAGLVGDRPAVAVHGATTLGVQVEQADGSWLPLDLRTAVAAPDGGEVWIGNVAFGPLGLAADATVVPDVERPGPGNRSYVVHSTDGTSLSVVEIDPEIRGGVTGIAVSADAITVRLSAPDGDPRTPPSQTLFVGTPTG